MNDQVLNYSEPPFCRPLADADMLLLQFALLCHTSRVAGNAYTMDGDDSDEKNSIARLAFAGNGTARLVVNICVLIFPQFFVFTTSSITNVIYNGIYQNLLLHRFGVFDFLGFEKAPTANVDQYKNELSKGLYPPEIEADVSDESFPELVLPWTYCPAPDPTTCLNLVQELMHIIILLITVSDAMLTPILFSVDC